MLDGSYKEYFLNKSGRPFKYNERYLYLPKKQYESMPHKASMFLHLMKKYKFS